MSMLTGPARWVMASAVALTAVAGYADSGDGSEPDDGMVSSAALEDRRDQ